jgi:hypothetical protein
MARRFGAGLAGASTPHEAQKDKQRQPSSRPPNQTQAATHFSVTAGRTALGTIEQVEGGFVATSAGGNIVGTFPTLREAAACASRWGRAMNALVKYDSACRALAEARSVDEVKDIHDKAVAMAAYARQAKNKDLEADAVEIRMRATRRLDQLRQAQKETVGLNTGTRGQLSGGLKVNPPGKDKPTLRSQGIDKNLAQQGRTRRALGREFRGGGRRHPRQGRARRADCGARSRDQAEARELLAGDAASDAAVARRRPQNPRRAQPDRAAVDAGNRAEREPGSTEGKRGSRTRELDRSATAEEAMGSAEQDSRARR